MPEGYCEVYTGHIVPHMDAKLAIEVSMAAYEVHLGLHSFYTTLTLERFCREFPEGFRTDDLVQYLYARIYPTSDWPFRAPLARRAGQNL